MPVSSNDPRLFAPEPIKPGAWSFVIPPAILLLGGILFVVLLFWGLGNLTQGLTQVKMPGTTTLHLTKPGSYTVFYESQSEFAGQSYSTGALGAMTCNLQSKVAGAKVTLSTPTGSETYQYGSRAGSAIMVFTISQPGNYDFSATYNDGATTPEVIFAIGPSGTLLTTIGGAFCACFGSSIIAVLVLVWIILKRNAAKRRQTPPTAA